ncbi:NADH-quinone oxidoreductase subunit L [Flavisolibacter ginsenosidimutans]|uniref:NADH-ubiquinone oxidoreductase chain 5 n=1 Tax=Flavisolibacter ginsenosidimutans TaxID=661481 RepID=A0A5B8UIP7_9BACT|nr:NADH-quinone oxidoreductase subunit L [Flavisolibacter ginsenosidimutans]QEC56534.1 NADH-quinone oxidoreductase subunit L [Flavisolibacter ginsenosidimutans]
MKNLILLIPLLPFLGFLINGLLRRQLSKGLIGVIGSGTVLASFIISLYAFFNLDAIGGGQAISSSARIVGNPVLRYFDFINVGDLKVPFAFQIDQLSSLFLLIITGVGFLIHLYSTAYMHEEKREHFGRYFAYLNLFVFSMLLLVMGANYVIMFIGWEGVGLCSYLLIGYWFKNIDYTKAAKKAFVMNRIGDFGFLLAIFWIISKVHTTNFTDVFLHLSSFSTKDLIGITLLLFLGATGKSTQIPLYTWLPDAMAGPTPVSALIHAATMVTAGIYMIARSNALYSLAPITLNVVAIIGAATALLAATIALRQNDIKKVLAYSTVSQLGYMFLALGTGAYIAAVFHVMTHAFFKALLFLGSGSVIHAVSGNQDIRAMGGLRKALPVTYTTFLIGCLAIAGIAPLSGFFSKDAILLSAFEHNKILWVIGLLTAGLTAFYMFRLLFITFSGTFRGTEEQRHHIHESPAAMTIPLIVLAVLSIVGGFVNVPGVFMRGGEKLTAFLSPVIPVNEGAAVSHSTEWMLMGLTTAVAVIAIVIAWSRYRRYKEEKETPLARTLENKWYVDELYDAIVVKPLNSLGKAVNTFIERGTIDAMVNGVGRLVNYGSRQLRWLQSGQVGAYVLLMVISMVLLFIVQFFLRK